MFDENFSEKDDKTLQIAKEREQIKQKMTQKLKDIKFTDDEIKSVIQIIDSTEGKIEALKSSLIGTNINTDDPTPAMAHVLVQIKQLEIDMAENIKERIAQIQATKK